MTVQKPKIEPYAMTSRVFGVSLCLALGLVIVPRYTHAYTPESPEVVAAVERAAKHLENVKITGDGDDAFGQAALVGLALLKAERGLDHPRVQNALKNSAKYANAIKPGGAEHTYATSIVTIFLLEADSQRFRPQIVKLLDVLLRRQLRNGAWGYKGAPVGDTSQSQYCVLALWEAYHHGIDIPLQRVGNICHWFIRTQDPSGNFGYEGRDSGALGKRVRQSAVRHTMGVAGVGSLYICMDLLGFQSEDVGDDADGGLPPDVRMVSEDEGNEPGKKNAGPARGVVNAAALRDAINLGNRWFRREYKVEYGGKWQNYYLYGMERYKTFRNKVESRTEAEPEWYNDGVDYLLKKQNENGSWKGVDTTAGTCFAVFFLTRSTQKTVGGIMNQGVLKGGKGFQAGELRSRDGRIVKVPLSRSVSDLLTSLNEGNEDELAGMAASVAKLKFDGDPATRTKHRAMLRGLVSHRSYNARIVAVKTLAQQRNFDNIPALIYALSDPDGRVALEARNGLRFISRKVKGFGLPEQPNEGEVAAATEKWKAWYLAVRPDGKLFN